MSPWKLLNRHLLLIPAIFILGILTFYPFAYAIYASFFGDSGFIIVENYVETVHDLRFWNSLRVTLQFCVISVSLEFLLGFALASLLNEEFKGRATLRTLLMIPMIITPTVTALMFKHLMFDTELGMFNFFLTSLGLSKASWLAGPNALYSLVLIDVWVWTPFVMLILLAGLQSLPRQPFEAAKVDGASSWQVFIHITLPLLRIAIAVALFFRIIDIVKTFDLIMGTTQGGPGSLTETLNIYTYLQVFRYLHYNYGAALTIIMFLIILTLSAFLMRIILGRR